MNKILFVMCFITSLTVFSDVDVKEGYSVNGKIITVKSTAKYASAEKCMTYASSRKSMKAYTYNSSSKKCYVYASIRSVKPDEDSVSGLLSDS
ncbi:MAG: PAN domain-containing protein [Gammaproteobacteria bacterium]|tara:strand:- start:375 stop:653 length:279 start_codon:yes stop_codon:yes gene_type:complete